MKADVIILKNYDVLLKEVKRHVAQTQADIERIVVRRKIEMAWSIGKSISGHLKKNAASDKSGYGDHLFDRLQSDVGIEGRTLYRMYGFYKSYPIMPRNNEKLNWSHYQVLSGVKNRQERKYLEDLVMEKNLSANQLSSAVKKTKAEKNAATTKAPTLTPRRGKLFCYKLVKPVESASSYIDCGFKIYREMEKNLSQDVEIVDVTKLKKSYSLKKSKSDAKQVYTYKAYLKRVVDGDTLHAILDLGFGILHEEILRLRGINSAESAASGGEKATNGLKKILKNQTFFVVKTSSTDTYNRYLADIFLSDKANSDPQEVADKGAYLNQLLLDKKLAVLF